ncbi:hypothetical protein HanRHA438_Chr16g0746251 [Helianthus annuus]|nr:hypothetical protein HanHA300_Chr16g0598331 [Helianthus annuus]KAJ0459423.1 hypothetical protein HanHA89_Chr16g0648801 [Helianthus annuus]KAJ0639952.1 hypothetical protein HanLR1_Chr16g0609631 [Helianthus annuus]KAJ0834668.1 hypothetical protein HanRHA438_Chr16g0746251 [Helianthus annuus]
MLIKLAKLVKLERLVKLVKLVRLVRLLMLIYAPPLSECWDVCVGNLGLTYSDTVSAY